MLEIVNKIEELYALLTKRLSEVEKLKAKYTAETARLDGREASLQGKAEEVSKRESFIGEVENIKALRKETIIAVEVSNKELDRLQKEKRAIIDSIATEKHTLVDLNAGVKSNLEALKAKEAKLASDNKKLDDDRKNYKEQIIREIGKKI